MTWEEIDKEIRLQKRSLAMMLVLKQLKSYENAPLTPQTKASFEHEAKNLVRQLRDNYPFYDLPRLIIEWNDASPRLAWEGRQD